MKYTNLGKAGFKVSKITFGCMELGGGPWEVNNDEDNIRVLQTAFEKGITTFDTAEMYGKGHSEEVLGKALEGKRKECIFASKVNKEHLWPKDIRYAVEASLKRLKTDYLDIYYVHWPNYEIPIDETMAEFNKLKDEGIIRAIGVSNFSLEQLKKAMECARIDLIQPEYNLLQRDIEDGIMEYCYDNFISICSYNSIAKGILTGAFHLGGAIIRDDDFRRKKRLFLPEHLEKEMDIILLLKEIADSKGVTISQIAISWLFYQKGFTSAIVGTQNEKHFVENIKAVDIELSENELERLDHVSLKVINSL
ncbi:MAG TPA: aldo/keto reductase [Ruminiclostridium sp.]